MVPITGPDGSIVSHYRWIPQNMIIRGSNIGYVITFLQPTIRNEVLT